MPAPRLSEGHGSPAEFNPPLSTTPATAQQALLCNKLVSAGRRCTSSWVERFLHKLDQLSPFPAGKITAGAPWFAGEKTKQASRKLCRTLPSNWNLNPDTRLVSAMLKSWPRLGSSYVHIRWKVIFMAHMLTQQEHSVLLPALGMLA